MAELRKLKLGDLKFEEDGIYVSFIHAKARGEESKGQFLVPYNHANPHICFASPISRYIDQVKAALPHLRAQDPLFHRALKDGFGTKGQTMGVNMLCKIGKEVALELGMENPGRYTGHCFRRSSATELGELPYMMSAIISPFFDPPLTEFYVLFVPKFWVFFDTYPSPLCADIIYGSPPS